MGIWPLFKNPEIAVNQLKAKSNFLGEGKIKRKATRFEKIFYRLKKFRILRRN